MTPGEPSNFQNRVNEALARARARGVGGAVSAGEGLAFRGFSCTSPSSHCPHPRTSGVPEASVAQAPAFSGRVEPSGGRRGAGSRPCPLPTPRPPRGFGCARRERAGWFCACLDWYLHRIGLRRQPPRSRWGDCQKLQRGSPPPLPRRLPSPTTHLREFSGAVALEVARALRGLLRARLLSFFSASSRAI